MTEDEARGAIGHRFGPELVTVLSRLVDLVVSENARQNLIAASTIPSIWSRHLLDSLQLVDLADREGMWIDIGSGGGFPGLPVAIVRPGPVTLVEPRRKRAEFLQHVVDELGLSNRVTILAQRIEKVNQVGAILSARAVAGIEALFDMAHHCSGSNTRWLLPRGKIEASEIEQLRQRWRFVFHVEQSQVSDSSSIAIFDRVARR